MKHGIQKKIAERADVSPAFLSLVLAEKRRPSWKIAKRLAEVTGTDPVLWLEGSSQQIRKKINCETET